MFPDRARMVRTANILWLVLAVAPMLFLPIAALVTLGKGGLARDQSFIPWLFIVFVILSVANIGLTVLVHRSKTIMRTGVRNDPVRRTFLNLSTGSILSEANCIYGLILTLFSGSLIFGVGFSIVTWASLLWVRGRFKQNLAKLPDTPGTG